MSRARARREAQVSSITHQTLVLFTCEVFRYNTRQHKSYESSKGSSSSNRQTNKKEIVLLFKKKRKTFLTFRIKKIIITIIDTLMMMKKLRYVDGRMDQKRSPHLTNRSSIFTETYCAWEITYTQGGRAGVYVSMSRGGEDFWVRRMGGFLFKTAEIWSRRRSPPHLERMKTTGIIPFTFCLSVLFIFREDSKAYRWRETPTLWDSGTVIRLNSILLSALLLDCCCCIILLRQF